MKHHTHSHLSTEGAGRGRLFAQLKKNAFPKKSPSSGISSKLKSKVSLRAGMLQVGYFLKFLLIFLLLKSLDVCWWRCLAGFGIDPLDYFWYFFEILMLEQGEINLSVGRQWTFPHFTLRHFLRLSREPIKRKDSMNSSNNLLPLEEGSSFFVMFMLPVAIFPVRVDIQSTRSVPCWDFSFKSILNSEFLIPNLQSLLSLGSLFSLPQF